jgi:hypothetical protein
MEDDERLKARNRSEHSPLGVVVFKAGGVRRPPIVDINIKKASTPVEADLWLTFYSL